MKNKTNNKNAADPELRIVDPNIAIEVAHAEKFARDTAIDKKNQALGQTGLKKITKGRQLRRDAEKWIDRANMDADRAEKILKLDVPAANKEMVQIFQENVPHFNEPEGFWATHTSSISWDTDETTQKRILELRTRYTIETGMYGNWLVVISDEDEEPGLYYNFSSYSDKAGEYNGEPYRVDPQNQLVVKTEISQIYGMFQSILTGERDEKYALIERR